MKGYIYRHTFPNGKCYIGQTTKTPNERWNNGLGYLNQGVIWKAIKKYGWDNIKHEVLEEIYFEDIGTLNKLEEKYIKLNNSICPSGYNLKSEGENHIISEEYRKRRSKILLRQYKEGKRERGPWLNSQESIRKRVKTFKERGCNKGPKNGMYGKSPSTKGKKLNESIRLKISLSKIGRVPTNKEKELKSKIISNMIWVTNGIDNKRINKNLPIEEGWHKGITLSEEIILKHKNISLGKKVYNNGENEIWSKECPEGYKMGRLPKNIKRGVENPAYKIIDKEIIDSIIKDFKYLKDGINYYNISLYLFNRKYKEIYGVKFNGHLHGGRFGNHKKKMEKEDEKQDNV